MPKLSSMEMAAMFNFLRELESMGASYRLGYFLDSEFPADWGWVTVHVDAAASQYWEVDFFADGTINLDRFEMTGRNEETPTVEAMLAELRDLRQ